MAQWLSIVRPYSQIVLLPPRKNLRFRIGADCALVDGQSRPIVSGHAANLASTILVHARRSQSGLPSLAIEYFRTQLIDAVPPILNGIIKDLKELCDNMGAKQALSAVCEPARLLNAPEIVPHFEHEELNLKQFQREINRIHGYSQAEKDSVRDARDELRAYLAFYQKDQELSQRHSPILSQDVIGQGVDAFGRLFRTEGNSALLYLLKVFESDSSYDLDNIGRMCLECLRQIEMPEKLAQAVANQGRPFTESFKFYLTHAVCRTLEIDTTTEDRDKLLAFVSELKTKSQAPRQ